MNGNAIIGQFGGPTSVINSSLCGLIQEGLKLKKIKNILGMRDGIIGLMKDEIVDLGKEDHGVIQGLRQTPSSALGSCRYILKQEDFPLVLKQLKKYNIRYFFLIGGNGSMATLRQIEQYCKKNNYQLSGIGIPKTVDNRVNSSPYQIELSTISLDQVAVKIKPMDNKYINTEGNFVTDEYIKYIKPLVGKLPSYSELNFIKYQ